ncbi:MAG: sugar phosphate isomerase/epimerase family protein [Promethearchaeota archaeon]
MEEKCAMNSSAKSDLDLKRYKSRITVISDEISQDIEHVLMILTNLGINNIEIRSLWGKNIALLNDEEIKDLKKLIDNYSMNVSMLCSPFAKCVLPNSKYDIKNKKSLSRNSEFNLGLFDRIIELSDKLETENIRIFNFLKLGSKKMVNPWKKMIDILVPYIEKAEKLGKTLLLENEHVCFADTIENTLNFFKKMKELNLNSIKLNLDPGNYYSAGEKINPSRFKPFYEMNIVEYMHIKDPIMRIPLIGSKFGVINKGKINYRQIIKQAIQYNFKGFFSLETHVLFNKEKTSIRSLNNLIEIFS